MTGPQTEGLGCGLNPLPKREINQPLAKTPSQVKTAFLNNLLHGTHPTECVTHKVLPSKGVITEQGLGLDDLPREVRTHVRAHKGWPVRLCRSWVPPPTGPWNLDPSGGGRAAFTIQLETLPLKNTKKKAAPLPLAWQELGRVFREPEVKLPLQR